MKKKVLSLMLIGAMTATMFAGCGSSSDSTADAGADTTTDAAADTTDAAADTADAGSDAAGAEKLTVWCWDPAFNIASMEAAGDVYKADHPDFELEVIETPWEDVQTKLTTAATSGDVSTLPDIILC